MVSQPIPRQTQLALRALHATPYGVVLTDSEGTIVFVNPAFERITGHSYEDAVGHNPRLLQSGHHDEFFYRELWRTLEESGQWQGEIWDRRASGDAYPEWLTISALGDRKGRTTHYVGFFSDISGRKAAEEHLMQLAYTEPLTGLPNRTLLNDRIEQALAQAQRNYWCLGLLVVDLDDFKSINDSYGHLTGDDVLREVANRMRGVLRAYDTLARTGGDEFVILLPHLEQPVDGEVVAAKLVARLEEPVVREDQSIPVHASIGIAVYPHDAHDMEGLIGIADNAMYRVKGSGKGNYAAACALRSLPACHPVRFVKATG